MAGPKVSRKFDRSIVEGSIRLAVWRLAWPTMLQNLIAGLQGIIDHAMVGHFVGYTGNAAIGVSWQIIIVVIVFGTLTLSRSTFRLELALAKRSEKHRWAWHTVLITS